MDFKLTIFTFVIRRFLETMYVFRFYNHIPNTGNYKLSFHKSGNFGKQVSISYLLIEFGEERYLPIFKFKGVFPPLMI